MFKMVFPSEAWLRRHIILFTRSSTTSLTSSEKTATSRGRMMSCLSTLRILSQSSPSLKDKTQDMRLQFLYTWSINKKQRKKKKVKWSLFSWQGHKVEADSRRDEAVGTSPHVSVLVPGLHVSPLGSHTLCPQHLRNKVTVSHWDNHLGPETGLENFAVHLSVLYLKGRRGNVLSCKIKLINLLGVGIDIRGNHIFRWLSYLAVLGG